MFNGLDYFIIVTFMAIIGLGFFNGVTRVSAAILAIYFSSIFAAAFYRPLTAVAREYLVSMSLQTGRLAFFVLLFFFFAVAFTVIISRWLGDLRLPRRVAVIDNIGGAALGVVVSGLAMTLAAMVLSIMLQALNQTIGYSGNDRVLGWMRDEIDDSRLVPLFLRMAPFFLNMISPWFPGGLPPILDGVPRG